VAKGKKKDEIKHKRAMSITVRISKNLDGELEKWALELGRTKNMIIERCIGICIDEFRILNIVGAVDVALGIIKIEDKIKKIFNERKIMENWKKRFDEAKAKGNEMFSIEIKEFSKSKVPLQKN
jgi:hypothetical protein